MAETIKSNGANLHECAHCGAMVEETRLVYGCDGDVEEWCDDCVCNDATACDRCGDLVDIEATVEVITRDEYLPSRRETEWWDPDCVRYYTTECDDCSDIFADGAITEYTMWDGESRYICDTCYQDYYYECDGCGNTVHADDVMWADGYPYCPDCYERYHTSDNLNSYHHTSGNAFWLASDLKKYAWQLTSDDHKQMFFGIELETDNNDDAGALADDIADAYDGDYLECKEDGSLACDGVEIVTQPMTLMAHLEMPMWSDVVRIVKNHGGTSHDAGTCGLHIHISRDALVDKSAYRLDRLFHRFASQMVRFSRRTSTQMHWCNIDDDTDVSSVKSACERKKIWKDKKMYAGRYCAVNDTNGATVEIRMWRGTLNMETLRATIEFTAALAMVANATTDDQIETLTWSQLKTLCRVALRLYGADHADLDNYLVRRGL